MPMNAEADVILLGAGHNAMVLQAYLSRSGLRTLTLERAPAPGGGLRTMTHPRYPGCLCHPHSFFHRGLTLQPWYRDLELARHGARYFEPELNVAMLLRDGRSLEWWTDLDRTVDSISAFSPRDGQSARRWAEEFAPIVSRYLSPEAQCPPLAPTLRRRLLSRSPEGRRLLEVSAMSPLEFVERTFEHSAVKAGMLFFNGLREVDLRLRGFGHAIPALLASPGKAQMCVGGSGELARALAEDIAEHGGVIRCGVEPRRLLLRRGRVVGVELASGERLKAQVGVASGLNPQQTFLDLLPVDAKLPGGLRRKAEAFQYNRIAPLFALNVVLREPPEYRHAARRPELSRAFMTILGLDRYEQFQEIVQAHERGDLASPVAWGACPTMFDPTQAPAGMHAAFLWEKVPYALQGDPTQWRHVQEQHGRRLLSLWREYAPNLTDDTVLDTITLTPWDTEQRLPNMRRGDLLVGSFDHGQVGANRPFHGAGQYRTPLRGLYLCGGSTHPGGNVTGLCGYNAARVIASDAGAPIWWNPPDLAQAWT